MNKDDKKFVFEGTTKALVTFIPFIGGAIGSIYSDVLADRKEKRFEKYIQELKEEIENNKHLINQEFIGKEDFLYVFELTSKRIINERSEEKRQAYKNILLKGVLSPNFSYDDLDSQTRLLDQLTPDHLLMLKLFDSPMTFSTQKVKSAATMGTTYLKIFKQILPDWGHDFLIDILSDLENLRLIENTSSNLQTMMTHVSLESFGHLLTSRGKTFVLFILRK